MLCYVIPIYLIVVPSNPNVPVINPLVRSIKQSTVGGWAFPVAGPAFWNNLPDNVTSALSLSTFCRRLKTFVFLISFPDIILD